MHEITVLSSILRVAVEVAKEKNAKKIITLKIRIGEMTHLNKEQILGCWEFLREGEELTSEAALEFEDEKAYIYCPLCGWEGEPEFIQLSPDKAVPTLRCSKCGSSAIPKSGEDCTLTDIVIEV